MVEFVVGIMLLSVRQTLLRAVEKIMSKYYQIVTNGKVFRITTRSYGGEDRFVANIASGKAREFPTKEAAEIFIHESLSMSGWRRA